MLTNVTEEKNTYKMTVAGHQVNCQGVGPQKCLVILKENERNWTYLYQQIEGFNYVPGYRYVLEIEEEMIPVPNGAADAPSVKYKLIKQVSRTKVGSGS